MARGKKKRNRRGQHGWKRQTPQSLREFWKAVEEAPSVVLLPLQLGGHNVSSYQELLAAYESNPRLVSMDLENWIRKRIADSREAADYHAGEADDLDLELEQKKNLLRGAAEMADRLKELNLDHVSAENADALREIMATDKEEGERLLGMLAAISKIQKETGREPTVGEVTAQTGLHSEDVVRLMRLATRANLADQEGAKLSFNEAITQKGGSEDRLLRVAGSGLKGMGTISIPTPTVRHFSKIAQEEDLPGAISDADLKNLAPLARHIVVDCKAEETESGRRYVRVDMICGSRAVVADDPGAGDWAGRPLGEVAQDFTQREVPPLFEKIRQVWLDRGWMRQLPNGEWEWLEGMGTVEEELAQWELRNLTPVEVECAFPLKQFGLLLEAGNVPVPDEDGSEMPIHGGARSFAAIWRRQARFVETVQAESREMRQRAKAIERAGTLNQPWEEDQVKPILAPKLGWSGRSVAASGVLAHLRDSHTVAVDMDVSEGLPDWETPEEAWDYARGAELPFPVTYFDFATPGGFRPKIALKSIHSTETGEEIELTLRAALCWKMDGVLTVAPFVWFAEAGDDPDDLVQRNDYDSPGALHFGTEAKMSRGDIRMDEELEPITHVRINTADGITGPSQVVLTKPLCGQPGWVDLFSNMDQTSEETEKVLRAEAMITTAAACRVLSVIYALDGTVNIELTEGEPNRRERREVERALKKGKQAEISRTVRIHPTRQDEREPADRPGKREYSHAFFRRGHFAHYPIGTRMADRMAEQAPSKLVDHPVKGLCRKIYRKPTIVGRIGPDGEERDPVAKSYVWSKAAEPEKEAA